MINNIENAEAEVGQKILYMSKDIEFSLSIGEEEQDLTFNVLYEESDDCKQIYAYEVDNRGLCQPELYDEGEIVDWEQEISDEINLWFDEKFSLKTPEEMKEVNEDMESVISKVLEILNEEGIL
jgi:hypothetical protein